MTFDNFLAQEDLASIWQGDQSGAGTRFSVTPPYDVNCLLPEFLMLRNVVEFSIQFHCAYLPKVEQDQRRNRYARNQHYFRLPFSQSQKEVRVGGIAATNENSSSGGDFPDDLPDYAKVYPTTAIVRITLLSDEGRKIFHAAQEDKRPDIENLEHLIDEYGFSFQRTILLPSPI